MFSLENVIFAVVTEKYLLLFCVRARCVSLDKKKQRESLQWIREQSMDERCIMSLATHDVDIVPQTIEI